MNQNLGLAAQAGMCQAFGLGKLSRHPSLIASLITTLIKFLSFETLPSFKMNSGMRIGFFLVLS